MCYTTPVLFLTTWRAQMPNTKQRKNHNNATLTIRIPEPILAQLITLSDAQFKNPSQVVRDLIVQHIQNNQAIFVAQQSIQPTQHIKRPMTQRELNAMREQQMREPATIRPQSPSTQLSDQQFADDWL